MGKRVVATHTGYQAVIALHSQSISIGRSPVLARSIHTWISSTLATRSRSGPQNHFSLSGAYPTKMQRQAFRHDLVITQRKSPFFVGCLLWLHAFFLLSRACEDASTSAFLYLEAHLVGFFPERTQLVPLFFVSLPATRLFIGYEWSACE